MITDRRNGRTYRWHTGSKFIAVWWTTKEEDVLPIDMISLPPSLVHLGNVNDMLRLVKEYDAKQAPQYLRKSIPAKNLPNAVLFERYTHVVVQPDGELHRIEGIEVHVMPDDSKMLTVIFEPDTKSLSLLPDLQVVVAKVEVKW